MERLHQYQCGSHQSDGFLRGAGNAARTVARLAKWRGRLRDEYAGYEEWCRYSDTYGLAARLGFPSNRAAWDANPMVEGSTNPADYRAVSEGKKPAAREGSSRVAKAPPGWGEKAMRRLKEQYPGHPDKAFATAWSLHKRGVSGEDYLSGKSSSRGSAPASYARTLDEAVAAACEPIVREAKKRRLKKKTRGRCVFPAESSMVTDDKDHFPINDLAQARNALARAAQYDACPEWYRGSLKGLQTAIRREVYAQFPGLKERKEEREGK